MKHALIALVALIAFPLGAAAAEADYLAARDAYLEKFKDSDIIGDADARTAHEAARRDLESRLRPIIGPTRIAGFPAEGTINLESLSPGVIGFGLLDGLVYASPDGKTRVLVTTNAFFLRWLAAHKDDVPMPSGAALRSDTFYTHALYTDAALFEYAEIPVAVPAKAGYAFAMLIAHAQDVGPRIPDRIIVSLVRGGRLYIATAPAEARVDRNAECEKIWELANGQAQAVLESYGRSAPKDDKLFEQYSRLRDNGDLAFRQCFGIQARTQSYFPALVRQAQALVDALPAK